MSSIHQRVDQIEATIQQACNQVGRVRTDIQEIVVTKHRTIAEIQEMYRLGFRHFAENRVENLLQRQEQFPQEDIIWHLIGPLQKRKVKQIVNHIQVFHALDRLSIADEIEKRLEKQLPCFIEVNVSNEESKHGFHVNELMSAFDELCKYKHIHVVGLMTMAPFDAEKGQLIVYFSQLYQLKQQLEEKYKLQQPLQLSMGMSNDYVEAICCGATHIRIGTAWFEE